MVDIAVVQAAAYRIAKVGTSGYDSTPEFIGKANEVQGDLMNLLTPHYGKIQAIDDILDFLVEEERTPDFEDGIWIKPNNYYGFVGSTKGPDGSEKSLRKIKTNAIGATQQNSIRRRTNAKPGYAFVDGNVRLVPLTGDPADITLFYFRKPSNVTIATTPAGDDDDDYLIVSSQTNFEWPDRVKNLLIYLLVQRLGVEMKEPILFEVSQLGIQQNLTVNSAE